MFNQIMTHSRRILLNIAAGIASLGAVCAFSSCGMINDDLEECNQGARLRFVYDYNLEYANAFPSQVDCLTLLIYDEDGAYVGSRTASAPVISDENYRMNIDLEPGSYHFVAYGGMDCDKSSFHFRDASTGTRSEVRVPDSLRNLEVAMNADCITAPVGTNLHKLFYGALDLTVPEGALDYTEGTVKMIRDTNDLRIVLQQVNGEDVPDSAFTYRVTADNTLLDYKNDVVPVGDTTFYPWTRGQIRVGENQYGSETVVAFAQFSLSRMVVGAQSRLTINEVRDGREVLSIPLIPYMLALRNQQYEYMEPQEYLDRDNSWEMIFFLDSQWRWVKVEIIVNGWRVKINDIEFGD